MVDDGEMGTILRTIERQRDAVELSGPSLKVYHMDGQECQLEMTKIGSLLSDGATRYVGYYVCSKHPHASVKVELIASPDVPAEIYGCKKNV
jgi:hypothetical protein